MTMTPVLPSIKYPGRPMHSTELLDILGQQGFPVKGGHPIPKELKGSAGIDGRAIFIVPATKSGRSGYNGKRRIYIACPECGKHVCAGHIDQHVNSDACWAYGRKTGVM